MEHGGFLKSHRGLDYLRARRELISSFVHSIQHRNFSSLFFPLIIYLWCLKKSEMSDNDETRSHNVRRAIELKSCLVGDDDEMKNVLYWRAREHTQQTRGVFVHKFISTLKVSFFSFFFFREKILLRHFDHRLYCCCCGYSFEPVFWSCFITTSNPSSFSRTLSPSFFSFPLSTRAPHHRWYAGDFFWCPILSSPIPVCYVAP